MTSTARRPVGLRTPRRHGVAPLTGRSTADRSPDGHEEVRVLDRPAPGTYSRRPRRWFARHPAWPVTALLAGYPLWWALGLAEYMFALLAIPMVAGMYAWKVRQRRSIRLPPGFGLWLLFLVVMLAGVAMLTLTAPDTVNSPVSHRLRAASRRHRRRAGAPQGAVRLHQRLGQLPVLAARLAGRGLVGVRHQKAACDHGRGAGRGHSAACVLARQRSMDRPCFRGLLRRCAHGGQGQGRAAWRGGRRAHAGWFCVPREPAAADRRAAAVTWQEQHDPRVAFHGRGRRRPVRANHRVRRHKAAAWQPALDRRGANGQLPAVRPICGGQQWAALAAAGLQRVRWGRALLRLLRLRRLAVPA